jgi:biotin carboxyl carrier protein
MKKIYVVRGDDGQPRELVAEYDGTAWTVAFAGVPERFHAAMMPDGRLSLVFEDGRQFCARGGVVPDGVEVSDAQGRRQISIADPLHDRMRHSGGLGAAADSDAEIRAQMPGRVVEIKVAVGDRVEAGAILLVLEAMKMQNEIRCDRAGIVDRVDVAAGQPVEGGALMLSLRPE